MILMIMMTLYDILIIIQNTLNILLHLLNYYFFVSPFAFSGSIVNCCGAALAFVRK